MKILLTGPQCSGKTTVLRELQNSVFFKNYNFIIEAVRNLVRLNKVKVNEQSNDESQLIILDYMLKDLELTGDIVYDRSILDVFAYTTYFYNIGQMNESTYNKVKEAFIKNKDIFDKIFVCVPDFDIIDDGFRSTDNDFRLKMKEIFDDIIIKYNLNVVYLNGSLENRIKLIQENLKWF